MRRKRYETARDRPDVQVVDRRDTFNAPDHAPTSARSIPLGTASISTSSESRTRLHAETITRPPMRTEATGSTQYHPKALISTPARSPARFRACQ